MNVLTLQEWVTISGATSAISVAQNASDYLDMSPFESFVAWIDASNPGDPVLGNSVTLSLETAPVKEEAYFVSPKISHVGGGGGVSTPTSVTINKNTAGVFVLKNLLNSPASSLQVPLARWLRWRLTGATTSWALTFRILIAAYCPVS